VVYVLKFGDQPELYGLPKNPRVPWAVTIWKNILKPIGSVAMFGALCGTLFHFVRFGRNEAPGSRSGQEET
jgi:formate dehydrogenase iron-sulfur subunit